MYKLLATVAAGALSAALLSGTAIAGPIFLTGHDPDFHAQPCCGSPGAQNLLREGLEFALGGASFGSANKILWVESFLSPYSGHLVGEDGLNQIGLTNGVHYDWVDAAGLASANLANYKAIGIASTFGGMLTSEELNGLIARASDIKDFINAGGGLFASAECFPASGSCDTQTLTGAHAAPGALFGFLPVTVTSISANPPFTLTPYGMSLGLVNSDMQDPTHNSFGLVGGLNIVDTDSAGNATTLAGVVRIGDGGFEPVPEPATLALFGAGLLGLGAVRRRKKKA